ncbi:copper type II ascorbate-dependent monooxygenase domain protein [Ancylostoma caninum]|uniref:Copper type II ascorbate-dependent monooxygenase domain protein n=1 Tax=Ancylostoma caninum TaxID=29170 RepID=A0A368GNI4_ANCCA|nr:copper type II ascorbate-dependent monooxygenase domain protein [Ancylostoma caninum]
MAQLQYPTVSIAESFETACVIEEDVVIHPFAFRTHAHRHGVDVSGWVVNEDEKGDDQWFLIGRRNPQLPQMFAPVQNTSLVVRQGDMLAARCIMKNDEDRVIKMGPTGEDEMCNFYMMYWAEGDRVLKDNTCFSPGAPVYHWSSEAGLNHIPK